MYFSSQNDLCRNLPKLVYSTQLKMLNVFAVSVSCYFVLL